MIGFLLSLIHPRAYVQCSVCGWEAPRSRMWRNCWATYVCQSEAGCYMRFQIMTACRHRVIL